MEYSSFVGLVNNCALLLTLVLVYDLLDFRQRRGTPGLQRVVSGIVLGGIAIAVMVNPWNFGHGVVFDTRSVLLCIVGFFFGTVSVAIAALMSAMFRWYLGGTGTWVGVAVRNESAPRKRKEIPLYCRIGA